MITVRLLGHENLLLNKQQLHRMLNHKPELSHWVLEQVLQGSSDELRADAAIVADGDVWVGNTTLFHNHGIGLIGNVYLHPEYRGRGLGNRMMLVVNDLAVQERHHTHVLWVDPIKRPAAFALYKKHGFLPRQNTGLMVKQYSGEDSYTTPTELKISALRWCHYPELNLLTSLGRCDTLISFMFRCYGFATFELEFVHAMSDLQLERLAIENQDGLAVGAIFLTKDHRWEQQRDAKYNNRNFLFDVIIDSAHAPQLVTALQNFSFPAGRTTTYVNVPGPKYDALSKIFDHRFTFENHFTWKGQSFDVAVLTKETRDETTMHN